MRFYSFAQLLQETKSDFRALMAQLGYWQALYLRGYCLKYLT